MLARFLKRGAAGGPAMSDEHHLTRRAFTVETALAMLAGVTITITGCGDGDDNGNPGPGPSGTSSDRTGTVSTSAGHTHSGAVITGAQLSAPGNISLTLTGSGHTHTVALTAAEVMSIAGGTRVSKDSSSDNAHTHTVTFN
jgi:hypothetical protein